MKDPPRLCQGRPDDLGCTLVTAGIDDQPSQESLERTLAVLGVGGALLTAQVMGTAAASATAVAKSGSSAGGLALFAKWMLVGAVGGGTMMGTAVAVLNPSEPEPLARPQSSVRAPEAPKPRRVAFRNTAMPAASVNAAPSPSPLSSPRVAAFPTANTTVGIPLAAEVATVDQARSALNRGDYSAVQARLAGYEAAFPGRQLLPEVLYLRLEAADRLGQSDRARFLARRILAEFPRSPQAVRAQELLGL